MNNHIKGELFTRPFFIDMVVDRFIFKNMKITFSRCFTFIPKTGVGLPETRIFFTVHRTFRLGLISLGSFNFRFSNKVKVCLRSRLMQLRLT